MKNILNAATSAAALTAITLAMPVRAATDDTVIHAGQLIDGVSGLSQANMSVVIKGERVVRVEKGFIRPEGSNIVDLSSATVLPGLIDAHVHITNQTGDGNPIAEAVTTSQVERALHSTVWARKTLLAGFTSVRDVNAPTAVIVGLKRAINAGHVEGPRIWAAGTALGPTGGHSDRSNGLDPLLSHPTWDDSLVDGADSAVKAVRRLEREGADLIKIMPSGGVVSIGDDPQQTLMSDAEISAVIDTAHQLGMKVASHGHGKDAIIRASRLGADSIEHGSYGDDETYKVMKANGTYLVPTLLVADTIYDVARNNPGRLKPSVAAKALVVAPMTLANVGKAYRAGVKIAFGTDQFLSPHGENAREFALMVKAGISPRDSILAATKNAADLLGASEEVGSIQAGRYADIIAVSTNPLDNVTALEKVGFVMKGGKVVKGWRQ